MKFYLRLFFIFSCVVLHFSSHAQGANKIKFGFNPSNSPPLLYQFENEGRPIATGGLVYEVSVAIAEELNEDYSIVRVPKVRIPNELLDNKIDILCHSSQTWGHKKNGNGQWSQSLFHFPSVLVGKSKIPFDKVKDVAKVRIGTVEGFFYGELEPGFKSNSLSRESFPSTIESVQNLLSGKIDYLVMSEVEFNFYKAKHPELQRSSFLLNNTEVRCLLSNKSPLKMAKLNDSIERLKSQEVFREIYSRYLNAETSPKPISIGLNRDNSPPFLFLQGKQGPRIILGGLFFEISLELGKKLKRPIEFVLLPRGRLDSRLAEGQIEMVCYNAEAWAGAYADKYHWSIPIFRQINVFVSLKDTKGGAEIRSFKDLQGKKIGTVLHFIYPSLAESFESGAIQREDAGSGMANLEKLKVHRVPYILLNELEFNYYKKKYPILQRSELEIDPVQVKCSVSKKSDLKINDVNKAILELKKSGRLHKIFFPHEVL